MVVVVVGETILVQRVNCKRIGRYSGYLFDRRWYGDAVDAQHRPRLVRGILKAFLQDGIRVKGSAPTVRG